MVDVATAETTPPRLSIADVAGNEAVGTPVPAAVVSVDVPLALGWNLIGIPVQVAATTTFKDLEQEIADQGGAVSLIFPWNELSQVFVPWAAGAPDTNNRVIESGAGYFVRVVTVPTGGVWQATGPEITSGVPLDLDLGYNLVSVPFQTPVGGYRMSDLSQAISVAGGTVNSMLAWNAGAQVFTVWVTVNPAVYNLPIDSLAGYFVRITTRPPAPFVP